MKAREKLIKMVIDKGLITDEIEKRKYLTALDSFESEIKHEQLTHIEQTESEFKNNTFKDTK